MLRRHLPRSVEVGRGFVVSESGNSGQLDVLIYSADVPVLFRDGDLVFVTPDAVLGVIEVKTKIHSRSHLTECAMKLAGNARWCARKKSTDKFFGLFAYESEIPAESALPVFSEAANGEPGVVTDLACLGDTDFVRWSKLDIHNTINQHGVWRAYQRMEGKAIGYFLHNIIQLLAPKSVGQNTAIWFPAEGKDAALVGEQVFEPRAEFALI
jgi:hypothetical protein